jgi:hypothetical protein
MRIAAAVTLMVFGALVFVPVLAMWVLTLKRVVARRSNPVIAFPVARCTPEQQHRKTDAA